MPSLLGGIINVSTFPFFSSFVALLLDRVLVAFETSLSLRRSRGASVFPCILRSPFRYVLLAKHHQNPAPRPCSTFFKCRCSAVVLGHGNLLWVLI